MYFYTNVYLKQPSVKGWYPNFLNRHMPQFIYLDEAAPVELIPGQGKTLSARSAKDGGAAAGKP